MIDAILRRLLHHIFTCILTISDYTDDQIDEFCQAFIDYAVVATGSPTYQTMAHDLQTVLIPFHKSIEKTDIDKGERSTDVKVVKSLKEYIVESLTALRTKVNGISHDDKNIVKEFRLNKISLFYSSTEHNKLKYFSELQTNIASKPAYASLVADVDAIVAEVNSKYQIKKDVKISIRKETTDKSVLLGPIIDVLRANFFDTGKLNVKTLENIPNFFRTEILDGRDKASGFLYVNEYIVTVFAGMKKCDPRVKFIFDSKLKGENTGSGDVMVFLSSTPNPTTIPDNAQLIKAGETIEFPIANIGSRTQLFLIFAAVSTGLDVEIMITVK